MKAIAIAIIAAALCGSFAGASFMSKDAGTSTAQFLKLGAGARAAGLGEAFAGLADDSTSIYWNPAGLTRLDGKSLSMMHAVWFGETSYDWLAYAMPLGKRWAFGVGAQYMSYGNITKIDSAGSVGGDISPSDVAFSLSIAKDLKFVSFGVNLKYVASKIENSAVAYGGDAGLLSAFMDGRMRVGLAVQNIGTKMKFISEEDPLPMNIKLGGAFYISDKLTMAVDANQPVDNEMTYGAGAEYRIDISRVMSVAWRVGYNTRNKDTGGLNGICAGAGCDCCNYTIDYAFVPYGDLGQTQRISLGIKF
jgi:hypothetical protein